VGQGVLVTEVLVEAAHPEVQGIEALAEAQEVQGVLEVQGEDPDLQA